MCASRHHIKALIVAAMAPACWAQNGAGLVVLHPSASGALTMSGQSHVQVPANAVYVNSSHSFALKTSGQCLIDTPHLYTCSPSSSNVASHCSGQTHFSACSYADPLCNVCFPTSAGMANYGNKSISSSQVVTLQPGRYGNISISGQAQVTFQPGVYLIEGDMSVTGQVHINGAGVALVFSVKSLSISGGAEVNLTPPASGNLAGIVMSQPPCNSSAMSLSGGSAMNIAGTIYLPGAEIKLSGQGTVEGEGPQIGDLVIVRTATMSGQGLIKIGRAEMVAIELPKLPLYD
jgi:hypothetical protein